MNFTFHNFDKFFDNNGYTSTSANYIANKAKEISKSMMVKNISFINRTATSLNNNQDSLVDRGMNVDDLKNMSETLINQGSLIGLISWLREAIKAKEHKLNHIENIAFGEWMEMFHPDVNMVTFGVETKEPEKPVMPKTSVDEYINENMSVKDVARYLYLLAQCSNIGTFIHPQGDFANARDYAIKHDGLNNVKDYNASTVVFHEKMSVPTNAIDDVYFELQEKHREYQKELNAIKFGAEREIQKMKDEYSRAFAQWEIDYGKMCDERKAAENKYRKEYIDWKTKTLEEARNLKIIIPNDFKSVVEFVNNFRG